MKNLPLSRRRFLELSAQGTAFMMLPGCANFISRELAGDFPEYVRDIEIKHRSLAVKAVQGVSNYDSKKHMVKEEMHGSILTFKRSSLLDYIT